MTYTELTIKDRNAAPVARPARSSLLQRTVASNYLAASLLLLLSLGLRPRVVDVLVLLLPLWCFGALHRPASFRTLAITIATAGWTSISMINGARFDEALAWSSLVMFGLCLGRKSADELVKLVGLFGVIFGLLAVLWLPRSINWFSSSPLGFNAWTGEKNLLGYSASLALVGLVSSQKGFRSPFGMTCVLSSLAMLVTARSSGAYVLTAVSMLWLIVLNKLQSRHFRAPGYVPFAVSVATGLLAANSATLLDFLGKDSTGTGRTVVWSAVRAQLWNQPVFGSGSGVNWTNNRFGTTEMTRSVWRATGESITSAHNGYVEALVVFGVPIGILISVLFIRRALQLLVELQKLSPLALFALLGLMMESFATTGYLLAVPVAVLAHQIETNAQG
jgi:O-antigen ligase